MLVRLLRIYIHRRLNCLLIKTARHTCLLRTQSPKISDMGFRGVKNTIKTNAVYICQHCVMSSVYTYFSYFISVDILRRVRHIVFLFASFRFWLHAESFSLGTFVLICFFLLHFSWQRKRLNLAANDSKTTCHSRLEFFARLWLLPTFLFVFFSESCWYVRFAAMSKPFSFEWKQKINSFLCVLFVYPFCAPLTRFSHQIHGLYLEMRITEFNCIFDCFLREYMFASVHTKNNMLHIWQICRDTVF